jgi:hypothetical protein
MWQFPNSMIQIFVIGTNGAVWTRWTLESGGWSGWTSMGGVAIEYPPCSTVAETSPRAATEAIPRTSRS